MAGTTDAAWLAGRLNAELRASCDGTDVDPVQALTKVEANVHREFIAIDRELPGRPANNRAQPSHSRHCKGSFASDRDSGLPDYLQAHTGEIGEFNPSDSGAAEALIVAERNRLVAEHPGQDHWPRFKGFIRTLRELANQDGGYSVVHPTRAWSNRVKRQIHEVGKIRHLLLVSDGFYRLVDVFGIDDPGRPRENVL